MPCNLAVTITKVVVAPEHLRTLLTPEVIQSLVQAFVAQHPAFTSYQPVRVSVLGSTVLVRLGRMDRYVSLTAEQVTANFPRYEQEQAPAIVELFTQLLAKGADKLFATQVRTALAKDFGQVSQTSTTVSNQGQKQNVTLFSFDV
jgi:hypothetical protein